MHVGVAGPGEHAPWQALHSGGPQDLPGHHKFNGETPSSGHPATVVTKLTPAPPPKKVPQNE